MIKSMFLVLALSLVGALMPATSHADGIDFSVRNSSNSKLYLRFFDSSDGVWPGGRKFYILSRGEEQTYRLNCRSGEKICYGAIDSGDNYYWGLGEFGREGCKKCCRTCGGLYTKVINFPQIGPKPPASSRSALA